MNMLWLSLSSDQDQHHEHAQLTDDAASGACALHVCICAYLPHEDVTSHPLLLKYLALQPPQKSLMQVALGNRRQVETSHGSAKHATTGVPGGHFKTDGALL